MYTHYMKKYLLYSAATLLVMLLFASCGDQSISSKAASLVAKAEAAGGVERLKAILVARGVLPNDSGTSVDTNPTSGNTTITDDEFLALIDEFQQLYNSVSGLDVLELLNGVRSVISETEALKYLSYLGYLEQLD